MRLIDTHRLVRTIEGEGRHKNVELLAIQSCHLITADHNAGWRRQGRSAGIFIMLAGAQNRLLTNDARSLNLLQAPQGICDLPMPSQQLHRLLAAIFDAHIIGPDEVIFARRGLIREIARRDRYRN